MEPKYDTHVGVRVFARFGVARSRRPREVAVAGAARGAMAAVAGAQLAGDGGVRRRPARLLLPRPRDGLVCLVAACLVWRVPLPLLLWRLAALFALPLFDLDRAVRDVLGENTPNMIEIRLRRRIEALLAGEPPPPIVAPPVDRTGRSPTTHRTNGA